MVPQAHHPSCSHLISLLLPPRFPHLYVFADLRLDQEATHRSLILDLRLITENGDLVKGRRCCGYVDNLVENEYKFVSW